MKNEKYLRYNYWNMNNNLLLAGVLVCLVVGAGVGYYIGSSPLQGLQKQVANYQVLIRGYESYNSTAQNRINGYLIKIDQYKTNSSTLTNQVKELQGLTNGYQDQIALYKTQNATLQGKIMEYQSVISYYEGLNGTIQNQIDEYQTQIVRYTNQVSGLQDQVNNYQSQINLLQSISNDLQNDVTELNHIVNMEMSTTLEQSKAVNIPRASSVTYSYSTLYSGYITVNFIPSGGVHFFIGNSEYGYFARFPVSNPDHYGSGSFTVPVGRGTTSLQIVNPVGTSTLDVTFSVSYVY